MSFSIKEHVRPFYLKWLYFPLYPRGRPAHFTTCWDYPEVRADELVGIMGESGADDWLWLPMTDWHTRIQRTQHLALALARQGQRSFYLNPHLGREFPRPFPFSRTPRFTALADRITEAHVHLPREPVFHHRRLRRIESAAVQEVCESMLDGARSERAVQMVSFPVWLDLALALRRSRGIPIVYDCHDVLSGFRQVARELVHDEQALLRESDLVVFSSMHLLSTNLERYPWLEGKSVLIRNAVDANWVQEPQLRKPDSGGPGIIIGYIGALDFWFDTEAVEAAARKHPEWKFWLVGRVEDSHIRSRLSHLPNIAFRGEIPHSALHDVLAKFRVGLIPFQKLELTIGTNPIKLYEYFSHRLPVVSTRLPETEAFGELVYLYDNKAQFVQQLERAVAEQDPGVRQRRAEVAHLETWDARAGQLCSEAKRLRGMSE